MKRQVRLIRTAVLAVVTVVSLPEVLCAVTQVDWYGGEWPPCVPWTIAPSSPMVDDVISFCGPTDVYSNPGCADAAMGGLPTLTIDHGQKTVQLWFDGPGGLGCYFFWAPVCGLVGQFGPLSEGDWTFFCDGTVPPSVPWPPPYPEVENWPIFSIGFHVSSPQTYTLEVYGPDADEVLLAGSSYPISWTDSRTDPCCAGIYYLRYSPDNGQSWSGELTLVFWQCWADWVVPEETSNQCIVEIVDATDPNIRDTGDNTFSIYQCQGLLAGDFDQSCYVDFRDYAVVAAGWSLEGEGDMSDLASIGESWCQCGNPYDPSCGP